MGPILMVAGVLVGVWLTASVVTVCVCNLAHRSDAQRSASREAPTVNVPPPEEPPAPGPGS